MTLAVRLMSGEGRLTASVHVSNIPGKLNVASRGEAAAAAHRLHLFG
jgi:DNA-binding NarL/FixJ family response regulator